MSLSVDVCRRSGGWAPVIYANGLALHLINGKVMTSEEARTLSQKIDNLLNGRDNVVDSTFSTIESGNGAFQLVLKVPMDGNGKFHEFVPQERVSKKRLNKACGSLQGCAKPEGAAGSA